MSKEGPPEVAANTVICLIHQANYLLDQQLRSLEQHFLAEGGLSKTALPRPPEGAAGTHAAGWDG